MMGGLVVLASILTSLPPLTAYLALGGLIAVESAGVPVPGETALIAAGLLASTGHLDLAVVIVVAAGAAIAGDNVGYLIGRTGGRRLLERPGRFERHRREILVRGEPFFERHGPKAVFLGRWVAVLRIGAAWLAGANRMPWRSFLFWNALGGIAWAAGVAVLAYALGPVAERLIHDASLAAGAAIAILVLLRVAQLWRRRAGERRARSG